MCVGLRPRGHDWGHDRGHDWDRGRAREDDDDGVGDGDGDGDASMCPVTSFRPVDFRNPRVNR